MFCVMRSFSICIFLFVLVRVNNCENDTTTSNNVMRVKSVRSYVTTKNSEEKNVSRIADFTTNNTLVISELQIVKNSLARLNGSKCGADISTVLTAINNKEKWALKMLDATPKLPAGFLQGNHYEFGDFDECIYSKQPFTNNKDPPIQGQYCLADLDLYEEDERRFSRSLDNRQNFIERRSKPRSLYNDTIHRAICLPSSCTIEEVKIVLEEIFISTTNHKLLNVRLDEDKCHVNKTIPLGSLEIICICLLCVYILFVVSVTIYHYYFNMKEKSLDDDNKQSTLKQTILCFSLIESVKTLLKTKSSNLNLECTNGIRWLSMTMILCCHTMLFSVGSPMKNTDFYLETIPKIEAGFFTNSLLYGDSFLALSAFLMSYLLLRKLEKEKGKVSMFKYWVDRYVRLTPVYLIMIFFYCSLMFRTGQGPLWDSRIRRERDRCIKSWWTHIIYLNNYINTDDICLPQSWQNAADYQLFIVASLVMYSQWKWPKIGKVILGSVFLLSVLIPIVITFKDRLDPTLLTYSPEFYDITENLYFKETYIKAHMRANSYFVGVIFGYLLHKIQTKGYKIPKYLLWFGWIMATIFALGSMFSIAIYYSPHYVYNPIEVAIYSSLHKVAWCAALGWVILVCVTNNASLINKLLSWKLFLPLSRLTYCAYLVDGFIELYNLGTMRVAPHISIFGLLITSTSHIVLAYSASAVLTVVFEIPTLSLRNIIFKKG